jgi:hypothetical protein
VHDKDQKGQFHDGGYERFEEQLGFLDTKHVAIGREVDGITQFDARPQSVSRFGEGGLQYWVGEGICDAIGVTRHILTDRLVADEITALYGEPKVGKTFVAVACAVACATGSEFWGHRFPENGKVVYVAAERHEQAAERIRAQFLQFGYDNIPENVVLVGGFPTIRLSNTKLVEQLKQVVAKVNPTLIVFDTYVRLTDNDEDNSRDADNNIMILTEVVRSSGNPCSGLLVHHAGKDKTKGMRGSSALLAAVTTVWKVSRKSKSRILVLSMEDANSMALAEPCFFEIATMNLPSLDMVGEVPMGVVVPCQGEVSKPSRMELVRAVLSERGSSGMAIDELLAAVKARGGEGSESAVRRDMLSLVRDGTVAETRLGKRIIYAIA